MIFVGWSLVGYGLPERAGFKKKGYRQDATINVVACKDKTDNNWSSSENNNNPANNAWYLNFNNDNKNNNNYVRSVLASFIKPTNKKTKE